MNNVIRILLLIPMAPAYVIGFVLSPIIYGFLAGYSNAERRLEELGE